MNAHESEMTCASTLHGLALDVYSNPDLDYDDRRGIMATLRDIRGLPEVTR